MKDEPTTKSKQNNTTGYRANLKIADQKILMEAMQKNHSPAKPSFVVSTVAFIAVVVWGAIQTAFGAAQLGNTHLNWQNFLTGKTTKAIENNLDKNRPDRNNLIAFANALRYKLEGGVGNEVRLGKNSWLFLAEEFTYHPDGQKHLLARANLLSEISTRLKNHGTQLLVVLVPDKSKIYANQLLSGTQPSYALGRYQEFGNALQQNNVAWVDVQTALKKTKQQTYYQSDTHWNEIGANIAAQATATKVKELGITLPEAIFVTKKISPTIQRSGDLIGLMGLGNTANWLRPASDNEAPVETKKQNEPNTSTNTNGLNAGGLLGTNNNIVTTLVGTSFSKRGNFYGYLQEALHTEILDSSKDGAGFLKSAEEYFLDGAFKSSPPKLLIWEIPERFLQTPPEQSPAAWLKKIGL